MVAPTGSANQAYRTIAILLSLFPSMMKYALIGLFVCCSFLVNSQSSFRITSISVSEGLTNGRVHDMQKDSLGYLWFATANGLTRYSGTSFMKYSPPLEDRSSGLSVLKLASFQGRIFALLQGGAIHEYDYGQDQWVQRLHLSSEAFTTFTAVKDQFLVIGTTQGFYLWNPITDKLENKQHADIQYIRRIHFLKDMLYVSSSSGLYRLAWNHRQPMAIQKQILEDQDILDFEIDANEAVWVGTDGGGLFRFHMGEVKPVQLLPEGNLSVRAITIREDGSILAAADRHGLFLLDHFGRVTDQLTYDADNQNSISQNNVNAIYVDEQDVIWLGVGEIGLDILYPASDAFEAIQHERYGKNTIDNDIIRSIYQDNQEQLWVGTESGLSKRDGSGEWLNFDRTAQETGVPVLTITEYQDQIIYGTYGAGLFQLNKVTNEIRPFDAGMSLKRVYSTYVDQDHLWIGGIDGPVHQYKGDQLIATHRCGQVKALERKDAETMLVGSVGALFSIRGETVSKYEFKTSIGNIYALKHDESRNGLWIGNDNGLILYDYATNEAKTINTRNETFGTVFSIIQFEANELWLATEKGLYKYLIDQQLFRKYGREDGQLVDEFGFGARSNMLDRRMAFGGPKGAILIKPEQIREDPIAPKLYLSGFLINGTSTEQSKDLSVFSHPEVALAYTENTLQFDIDYVKFHGSRDYRLEWQLVGFDQTVLQADNQGVITYQNLPPGDYRFQATIINADGFRSSNQIDLAFSINHPFWFQWWAFLVYAAFLGLVIYVLLSVNKARQDKKFSDEKIKFFVDVAHDIRTPVSLIRLASDQLLENNNVEESVQIINRYTRNLNEYVTELLDFQKSERKKLRIVATHFDLVELLKTIIADFQPMITQKELTVDLDFPETLMVWGDRVQLGRVFTNLMSNAVKYNHEKGTIWASLTHDDRQVVISIKDTGLGIPGNQIDKIFTRFHRADNALQHEVRGSGIGLMLSKRIVELHKGEISCESEEQIGSTFQVSLLQGKAHFQPEDLKVNDPSKRINRLTESIKGKKSIVVIEDNEDILAYLQKSLSEDYQVMVATDGKEGLFQVFDQKPDLVITDVMLPGMNGKELCHIIKNDHKASATPVILLTALSGMDDKVAGLEVGADFYLEKPFDIEVLKLAVKNLLKRSQLDQEIKEKSKVQKVETPEESFLSNVIDIINTNLTNHDFSIDQLCDEIGLSRSNLFRKMKAIAGLSPSDLIQEIKLNKAKQLLKTQPNARIDDIAYQSGFNDPKYFSTLFKKHFKRTPSEYQSLLKEA